MTVSASVALCAEPRSTYTAGRWVSPWLASSDRSSDVLPEPAGPRTSTLSLRSTAAFSCGMIAGGRKRSLSIVPSKGRLSSLAVMLRNYNKLSQLVMRGGLGGSRQVGWRKIKGRRRLGVASGRGRRGSYFRRRDMRPADCPAVEASPGLHHGGRSRGWRTPLRGHRQAGWKPPSRAPRYSVTPGSRRAPGGSQRARRRHDGADAVRARRACGSCAPRAQGGCGR